MANWGFIVYNWATVIVWYAFILLLSSLPDIDFQGDYYEWIARSLISALLYGTMFLAFFRALLSTLRMKVTRLMYWKSKREQSEDAEFAQIVEFLLFIIAIFAVIILASLDEYFQSNIAGRISDITDILVDTMGAVIASILIFRFPIVVEIEAQIFAKQLAGHKQKKSR